MFHVKLLDFPRLTINKPIKYHLQAMLPLGPHLFVGFASLNYPKCFFLR